MFVATTNTINQMLQGGNQGHRTSYLQNFKAQVIIKGMLLQRSAVVLGCQPERRHPPEHRYPYVTYNIPLTNIQHSRIACLLPGTSVWPRTFNAIREHSLDIQGSDQTSASRDTPQNLSTSQTTQYIELSYDTCSLQLVVSMLRWHCTVSVLIVVVPPCVGGYRNDGG